VLIAERGPGGQWSAPAVIGTLATRYARARASANAGGDAVVSVVDTDGDAHAVLARAAGGPWSSLDLGPVAPWARVEVDGAGAMVASWRDGEPDDSPGTGPLRVAERPAGGAFAEVPSPTGAAPFLAGRLSAGPGGDALLVGETPGARSIAIRPQGAPFSPAQEVGPLVTGSASLGDDGTVVVAWRAPAAGGRHRVLAAVRPPGGALGPPRILATVDAFGSDLGPQVAVASDGGAVVAWSGVRRAAPGRGGRGTVWAALRPADGTFGQPVAVNDRRLPAAVSEVAAGPGGAAVVTWAASTGRGDVLQAARFEQRPLVGRLATGSRRGGATARIRLGARARVAFRLVRLRGGETVARRVDTLPAGGSTIVLAPEGALPRGRYRLQVDARAASAGAGASAALVVAG
jgi:hypothetical protein